MSFVCKDVTAIVKVNILNYLTLNEHAVARNTKAYCKTEDSVAWDLSAHVELFNYFRKYKENRTQAPLTILCFPAVFIK